MRAARWKHLQILYCLIRVFGNGLAPKRFLTPFKFRSSRRLRNSPINGFRHTHRPTRSRSLAWRRLYGEKTVRKAERARLLSEGEESKALRINGARPHFLRLCAQVENVLFLTKWGLAPFIPGQKQRVFEPYCLSLSFKVASPHPQIFLPYE